MFIRLDNLESIEKQAEKKNAATFIVGIKQSFDFIIVRNFNVYSQFRFERLCAYRPSNESLLMICKIKEKQKERHALISFLVRSLFPKIDAPEWESNCQIRHTIDSFLFCFSAESIAAYRLQFYRNHSTGETKM